MGRKIRSFSAYLSRFVSDEHLDSLAIKSKFKQRKSVISPKSFLETLFFCNQQNSPTLTTYSIDLASQGLRKVSKQAVDKRFNVNTKEMLYTLLSKIMHQQFNSRNINSNIATNRFSDIQIMDSTEFRLSKRTKDAYPGYGGAGRESIMQLQFEYQLISKRVTHFSVESALKSDFKVGMSNLDCIKPNTLLLRDLAYVGNEYFKALSEKNLYFISKAKSQWNFYIHQDGVYKRLTTKAIIARLQSQKDRYLDLEVFMGDRVKVPVRLIANLLSEEQKAKRLKKKTANRKLGKDALESIGLNLFVTNVEKEKCSSDEIYQLYRLRWQIELMFKAWKSVMKFNQLHAMNAIRLECTVLIKFIWVMINWNILKVIEVTNDKEVSFHKLCQTLMSPSMSITKEIINVPDKIIQWFIYLCTFANVHSKEYKKTPINSLK